ncbi:MAG: hypothetical protein GY762_20075, partial [Proteobacteria bacterium]|nr:hypothetical protein [Pseudomonadota bacterium]
MRCKLLAGLVAALSIMVFATAASAQEIFSCETTSLGAPVCIDHLETDGWTLATAQANCDAYTLAGYPNQMIAESCISASAPGSGAAYATNWRCNGTLGKMGSILYVYGALFPAHVCSTYIGVVDYTTYDPDYTPCVPALDFCADNSFECGTTLDNCELPVDCGSCAEPTDNCVANFCIPPGTAGPPGADGESVEGTSLAVGDPDC